MGDVRLDNSAIEALLRDARGEALEDTGAELLGKCMENSPVKSGNLRRNHRLGDVDEDAGEVEVIADADYAAAVHEGWERFEGGRDPETGEGRGDSVASYEGNPWMTRSVDEIAAENG